MINKISINLVFLCELKNNVNGPNTPRSNVYSTALFFTLNLYIIFYEEYITFFHFHYKRLYIDHMHKYTMQVHQYLQAEA